MKTKTEKELEREIEYLESCDFMKIPTIEMNTTELSNFIGLQKRKAKLEGYRLAKEEFMKKVEELRKEDKWLEFKEEKPKPKTRVISVWSKCSNIKLGEIRWYPQWRHYCFVQEDKVFSDRCLLQIGLMADKLNGDKIFKEEKSK